MKNFGIILLVIGVVMTAFSGFTIITREKVVDLGALEITNKKKTPVYWSPILGGVVAFTGLAILLTSRKKNW